MEFFLLDTVILYPVLAYAVLFFGMFVEGDIILFTAGYLANFGLFTFGNVLGISIVGMLVGDCCWYALGTARVLPLWIRRALQRIAAPLDDMLAYRTTRMLLIAKFSYGIHRLILLRAGQNRIGFRRFMERDSFATVLWAVIVASLGYASSYSLSHIKAYFHYAEIGLLAGLILFFIFQKFVGRMSRPRGKRRTAQPPVLAKARSAS